MFNLVKGHVLLFVGYPYPGQSKIYLVTMGYAVVFGPHAILLTICQSHILQSHCLDIILAFAGCNNTGAVAASEVFGYCKREVSRGSMANILQAVCYFPQWLLVAWSVPVHTPFLTVTCTV